MKNLKDAKTKIVPSTTRGGKELPSSSALDSPSVLSKLATPPHAINFDMSQVIDDTTSAMNDTHDDASTMLDNAVPLGEFLSEQLAKAKEIENVETLENYDSPIMPSSPTRVETPDEHCFDRETARAILACNDRDEVIKLLAEIKEKSLKERMKYDPKFATSPIFVTDKDYEFFVDPELITLVESDPFHGYETE